jgi:hypothetical protein
MVAAVGRAASRPNRLRRDDKAARRAMKLEEQWFQLLDDVDRSCRGPQPPA